MDEHLPVRPLARRAGVAALVHGEQVGVFRTTDDRLHALTDLDPFRGAMVLSRGIVGSRGDRATVASSVCTQVFDLETWQYLDDPAVRLTVYAVKVRDGFVEVAREAHALSA